MTPLQKRAVSEIENWTALDRSIKDRAIARIKRSADPERIHAILRSASQIAQRNEREAAFRLRLVS